MYIILNKILKVLKTLNYLLLFAFLTIQIFPQTYSDIDCGMTGFGESTVASQKGGKWMTARDTLKVLIVFVQFPDDAYDTTFTLWPTNPVSEIYPGPTFLKTYIDSTTSQMSTN
ncbi:MAG: hypothetical protein HRF52_10205 [Ignavibacterium sp.]|jgi:hypothetical protein